MKTEPAKIDPAPVPLETRLEAMGFAVVSKNLRMTPDEDGKYPVIRCTVTLSYKGKEVLTTEYTQGIGHLKLPPNAGMMGCQFLNTMTRNPNARILDVQGQCDALNRNRAIKLPEPSMEDVLMCLVSDGEPYFNHEDFEDWAGNYGYDSDSRKAEGIYKQCIEIGRKLARVIPAPVIETLQELRSEW